MRRDDIDFHAVAERHHEIDERLQRWARWVRLRASPWQTQPMWLFFRSNSRQWHAPEFLEQLNTLECVGTERAVSALPEIERDAVRWHYVYRSHPGAMARELGLSKQGLADAVVRSRTMLVNRLRGA